MSSSDCAPAQCKERGAREETGRHVRARLRWLVGVGRSSTGVRAEQVRRQSTTPESGLVYRMRARATAETVPMGMERRLLYCRVRVHVAD